MKPVNKLIYRKRRGSVLIISMIFILVFSALAVSMASLSGVNLQIADNQRKANSALSAAQSGLECGKYLIAQTSLTLAGMPAMNTGRNYVTLTEADTVWTTLCSQVQGQPWVAGQATQPPSNDEIITPAVNFGAANASFQVRFYRDGNSIQLEGIGVDGQVKRQVSINSKITKDNEVLNYAIASRGRMWLTGDSTVHGNIYSAWQYQNISPFNMTSDSTVEGTINTILSNINPTTGLTGPDLYADKFNTNGTPVLDAQGNRVKIKMPYDLETLDANGNPVYDDQGNKVISPTDEIQGQCEYINYGVNYGDKAVNMPGMKITDYNTTIYYQATRTANGGSGDIPCPSATQYNGNDASLETLPTTCGTKWRYERFPHDAGNYTTGNGIQVKRYIYKDQTFTDARLLNDKNALFINCTFNDVLYVDCGKTTSNYNNVRFDNCTFNGTIVTNTPQTFNWQKNTLYYTGSATFQNTSADATILAPHFNVNLGNTNPNSGENNVLTGAIVGGIVDVRGNAEVFGTIISMADTSSYTSGYVSNIGATSDDGGSETTDPGDVGVINITPDPDKLLPSGITTPIVIKPLQDTYSEEI